MRQGAFQMLLRIGDPSAHLPLDVGDVALNGVLMKNGLRLARQFSRPFGRLALESVQFVIDEDLKQFHVLFDVGPVVLFGHASVFARGQTRPQMNLTVNLGVLAATFQGEPSVDAGRGNFLCGEKREIKRLTLDVLLTVIFRFTEPRKSSTLEFSAESVRAD